MDNWKFKEQENTAVITSKKVINHSAWIGYVSHDADDGGWQFLELNDKELRPEDAAVVSLKNIVDLDETINELLDLPVGWHASRESKESPWVKEMSK